MGFLMFYMNIINYAKKTSQSIRVIYLIILVQFEYQRVPYDRLYEFIATQGNFTEAFYICVLALCVLILCSVQLLEFLDISTVPHWVSDTA